MPKKPRTPSKRKVATEAGGNTEKTPIASLVALQAELKHDIESAINQRIFETSLDLILVVDRRGNILRVSPSSHRILGHQPGKMIGRSAAQFLHPDDLESTRAEMRRARRGRETRNFETRYLHRDGSAVTLSWTGVWSEPEGQYFFIGRDMTERKRSEETERQLRDMLAAVIDASPVAIICIAPDKTVFVWSRAAEQIFGYGAAEIIGKPYNLVPPDQEAEFERFFERALTGEILRDVQVQRRHKSGSLIDISFASAPMYDARGVRGVAYALADITERHALERQLRQAQKLEAIGQLTGGIAHDFNNILTVITGTIEVLAEAVANQPNLAAIAKMIDEAAERGAELTAQLLAFARKQPLKPRETDINALVLESVRLLRPTLGENIDIVSMLEGSVSSALVDSNQLSTALINLALNARDAMPNGGKLTIETDDVVLDESYAAAHSEVRVGPYVMIAVTDTGTGISKDIRDKIFEPFFTTKDIGKGTGLGLSMVYGFIKQSSGHINIYSEEGHGTTIRLYLPRAEGLAAAPEQTARTTLAEGGGETILVVEDSALVRDYVIAQLQGLGYATLSATNATEAIELVDRGTEFDLLFTDVIMPGEINGRQLAHEVTKRRPMMKVLYTSGYTQNAFVHQGKFAEGVLLLAKPYRKADLARMVRAALGPLPLDAASAAINH